VKHSRFKEFEHSPEFSTLELRDRIPDPSKEQTFTHRIWVGMRRCKVIIIRRPWISHAALLRFGERKLCLYWKQAGKVRLMSLLAVAGLMEAEIEPDSTVVCLVSGGNNDVSRYGEVLERSLVHLGLKHYFLVDFPQEPGALRRFLDGVLGPNDDITLFEYVKRNNRETGEALVGIELGSAADLDGLLERMRATEMQIETIEPGSPAYRYLL